MISGKAIGETESATLISYVTYRWVSARKTNSSALAMELCLSCTKPSISYLSTNWIPWNKWRTICRQHFHGKKNDLIQISLKFVYKRRLRLKQCGWHFANDIFKCIFSKKALILFEISLNLVLKCAIDNKSALVQVMGTNQESSHFLNPWWTFFTKMFFLKQATMS